MKYDTSMMKPLHNRKIVFGGIDMVGSRMSNHMKIWSLIKNEFEALMISSRYLENAPFLWIGIMFGYGLKTDFKTSFRRIDKKDGELELYKEIDMRVFLTADETDIDLLKDFFEIVTLDMLIDAGKKYKLKIDALLEKRSKLGNIPDWEYEMDEHSELLKQRYDQSLAVLKNETPA